VIFLTGVIVRMVEASKEMLRLFMLPCAVSLIAAGCAANEENTSSHGEGRSAERAAPWNSMLGLVTGTGYGACLTVTPGVTPSPTVTVITLPDSRVITAAVTGAGETCSGDVSGLKDVSYRLTSPGFEAGEIGVAVLLSSPAVIDGSTDLDANGIRESFRLCTSHEGVHVTAWAGEPLTSRRVWHRYHYLGYDVDPSCTHAETAGTPD
jgi:hypothetical protein